MAKPIDYKTEYEKLKLANRELKDQLESFREADEKKDRIRWERENDFRTTFRQLIVDALRDQS